MDYTDRVAVITGASRGIGEGAAGRFAESGMKLGLCARSAIPESERCLTAAFDIRDADALEQFTEAVVSRFGPIELWINNAGMLDPVAPLRDCPTDELQRLLDVNVMGTLLGARAYARHVRSRRGGGVLLNLTSGAAVAPLAGWSAYGASKAAVNQLSRCLALEEQDAGLRVHAVGPGIVDTQMMAAIRQTSASRFPAKDRFLGYQEREAFNSPAYVADQLLAIAFDPAARPSQVLVHIPPEHPDRL